MKRLVWPLMSFVLACSGAEAGPADAGSHDAGSPDGGSTDAGPADPALTLAPGAPLTGTPGQWTWIPFSDAYCGNGTTTGLALNLSATGTRVLIYLEGGGACWDQLTCDSLMTASYFTTGYGETDFTAEATDTSYLAEPGGFFDRTSATNPFKDDSYVYIPYCTGDIHTGDAVTQLGTSTAMFVGARNYVAFLDRIVPTFPEVTRAYIAGSSAGGFGAAFHWWRTQQAFGAIRVDLIDDSGPFMPADIEAESAGYQTLSETAWNVAATSPPGCTTCLSDNSTLFRFSAMAMPGSRGALLSYLQDNVLPTYIGISEAQFETGLQEDITSDFSGNMAAFVVNAPGHVLWFAPTLSTNGVTLESFLTGMVNDSTPWQNVLPPP